jgi:ferredoxin
MNRYQTFLMQFDEKSWLETIGEIVPSIHEVDRNAVQIWFRFHPLALARYLEAAEDAEEAARKLALQGDFDLKNSIDSSHKFLYGHRFWKSVKEAVESRAENFDENGATLRSEIERTAGAVSEKTKADKSLTLGISAVGLMTFNQVGYEAFRAAKGEIVEPQGLMTETPDRIVEMRAKDDPQGFFGFLKTVDKKFTVSWEDARSCGTFQIINQEEIASASGRDLSQNWRERDERCLEGVIPVECRSASCGTCWVGILAGQEKLSEVQHLERKQMKVFGYNQPDEEKPFMRLACQAKAYGNVSLVIPSWNGVFGKKVYNNVEKVELEPVTTAAKKLRETMASTVGK